MDYSLFDLKSTGKIYGVTASALTERDMPQLGITSLPRKDGSIYRARMTHRIFFEKWAFNKIYRIDKKV